MADFLNLQGKLDSGAFRSIHPVSISDAGEKYVNDPIL